MPPLDPLLFVYYAGVIVVAASQFLAMMLLARRSLWYAFWGLLFPPVLLLLLLENWRMARGPIVWTIAGAIACFATGLENHAEQIGLKLVILNIITFVVAVVATICRRRQDTRYSNA